MTAAPPQASAGPAAISIAGTPRRRLAAWLQRMGRLDPLFLLFLAYALVRLWGLERLAVNGDEAIYIYCGLTREVTAYLGEGKFFTLWLYSLILPWVWNPVWVARFLSVAAGAVTLWMVHRVSREPENRPAGVLPAVLIVVCPYSVFYDRVALPDAFLAMSAAMVLSTSWRLADTVGWRQAVWLGISMALGLLVKISGVLLLPLPLVVLLFFRKQAWSAYPRKLAVAYGAPVAVLAALFVKGGWGGQLGRYVIGIKAPGVSPEARSILATGQVNLSLIHDWMAIFLTQPFFYVAIGGGLLVLVRWRRFGLFWLTVGAALLLPFIVGAQLLFPHYLLFGLIPLYFCAGAAIRAVATGLLWPFRKASRASLALRVATPLAVAGLVFPMARYDLGLLSWPERLRFPWEVEVGFITEWPGGYGGREVYEYLDAVARRAGTRIRVLRFGISVGVARVLQVHWFGSQQVVLMDVDLSRNADRDLLRQWSAAQPTFVVMDDPPFMGDRKVDLQPVLSVLQPVFRVEKPGGLRAIVVYRYSGPGAGPRSDLLGGFADRKVVSDPAHSPRGRVELHEREARGALQPTVLTVAPVDLWLPMVETVGPSVLSFLLEVSDTAAEGLEAGVDFACAESRQHGYREHFNPQLNREDGGWHKRALVVPGNMRPGCWVILRAVPPQPAGVARGRVSWAQVSVRPLAQR